MKAETSGETLRELTDRIPTQIWQMLDENTYGYANATHIAFLGKPREEIEYQPLHNILPPEVADLCLLQNKTVYESKKAVKSEEWAPNAQGELRLLRIVKSPIFDTAGNISYLSCTADDITDEHNLMEQNQIHTRILRTIARFSRELFSGNPDAVEKGLATLGEAVRVDRVYYWENHRDEATGAWYTSQRIEWCATEIEPQIDNPDLQSIPIEAFSDILEPLKKKQPFKMHVKDISDEASRAALEVQGILSILIMPIYVDEMFYGFVGFDSCLREREWAEEEMSLLETFIDLLEKSIQRNTLQNQVAQSHENFDHFFNTIDDLLFILDLNGTMLHVNETVIRKTGYAELELIGQSVLLLHPPERRSEALEIVLGMIAGTKDVCPVPLQTKNGVQFPVLTRVCKGVWNGKSALFGVTQDMTELVFSEEKFSKAFNESVVPKLITSAEGVHLDVNAAFCRLTGYSRDEMVGKSPFDNNVFQAPEDFQSVFSALQSNQSFEQIEVNAFDRYGSLHSLLLSGSPINVGSMRCVVISAFDITERKRMENELKNYSENLETMVQDKVQEIANVLWGTVSSLVHLAESRDDNTGGHLKRLSESCHLVAGALAKREEFNSRIDHAFISNLQQACLLHDIGKVGISDSILLKPGKLTPEEFEEMKKHTTIGAKTLEQSYPHFQKSAIIQMAIDIALSHHERWDGKGYPNGLSDDEIPLSAQIVAVCDVYDALRSVRPYKPAFSHVESLEEIRRECGTHFSSAICESFFQCADELSKAYETSLI